MKVMAMTENIPTFELQQIGQSPWLDQISRELLKSGKLKNWIQNYGLLGVTSNPSIFEKAISQAGGGYDVDIRRLAKKGESIQEIYDALTISDIQKACDLFQPVFKKSKGEHGFVSLEVLPGLAYETEATIQEARRLFKRVARPNVMIKVPSTLEGIPAVRRLISEGININITLMFSLTHYQDIANAYMEGLEELARKGGDLSKVHSVASVFVSRIDTNIDKKFDQIISQSNQILSRAEIEGLKGKAAIANSKRIYQEFKKLFYGPRFLKLKAKGATVQKVLWGSTSTKNPQYPDLIYVENLIGPETVNTLPQQTFEAFLDHGKVRGITIEENLDEVPKVISKLKGLGIDIEVVCQTLQKEGVKSFCDSFDALMRTLENTREVAIKRKRYSQHAVKTVYAAAEGKGKQAFEDALKQLDENHFWYRFTSSDPTIWKKDTEHVAVIKNRLGWLKAAEWVLGKLVEIDTFVEQVKRDGIQDVVLLGMGGSSLAPEVMNLICPKKRGLSFHILDTTDSDSILGVERQINFKKSLFIVASKSGSTIETNSQFEYFYSRYQKLYKKKDAEIGRHFTAITDENSSLHKLAKDKSFRKIWINPSDIGGRYSALSFFGLVPAALSGIDIRQLVQNARLYFQDISGQKSAKDNSSLALGAFLGASALIGRDQLTVFSTPTLEPLGAWLEQLIAESTGKEGKGILPVRETLPLNPEAYGPKRVFLFLQYAKDKCKPLQDLKTQLQKRGAPVLEIVWQDLGVLGSEFLRWEIATAVASALLQVNPFDEPNVKESKENTSQLLGQWEKTKRLESPEKIHKVTGSVPFKDFFSSASPEKYLALLCYTERTKKSEQAFSEIQALISEKYQIPVVLGFGPRYLHSIGQFYKGGPAKGLFLFFINQESKDTPVPDKNYPFSQLKRAQAFGDIKAVSGRRLPVLALDLGKNISPSLKQLKRKLISLT